MRISRAIPIEGLVFIAERASAFVTTVSAIAACIRWTRASCPASSGYDLPPGVGQSPQRARARSPGPRACRG